MTDLAKDRAQQIARRVAEKKRLYARRVTFLLCTICALCVCGITGILYAVGTPGVSMVIGGYSAVLLRDGAGAYIVIGLAAFALGTAVTLLCMRYREKTMDKRTPE